MSGAQSILKVYEKMVGEKHTEINDEIKDAAGEIMNIILGQAKTILKDQKGLPVDKAIPTVVTGQKLKLSFNSNATIVILPFATDFGAFHLEIIIEKN